ncbi:hypothetical protein ON011_004093 [Providencia rettgeri]|nr:hypothetical protein [Providencia rettgeri]
MIDIVGLRVTDLNDKSSFVFNDKTSPAAIMFSDYIASDKYQLVPDGGWLTYQYTFPEPIPEGYDVHMPSSGDAEVTFRQSGDRRYVTGVKDSFTLDLSTDRKLTVKRLIDWKIYGRFSNYCQILIYPTINLKNTATSGLKIMGNNIFFNPIYHRGYAYAVFRKKIKIGRKFRPSEIDPSLNMLNAIYFFYCDDGHSFVTHKFEDDKYRKTIDHYFICRDRRDAHSENNISEAYFYVVAFSNQTPEQLDKLHSAGLKIRNVDGLTTFSSALKVLTKPVNIPASELSVNKGTQMEGLSRPMYSPALHGETFTSNGGAAQFKSLSIGNIDKNTVGLIEMNSWWARGHHGPYTVAISKAPITLLDAADYFYFP